MTEEKIKKEGITSEILLTILDAVRKVIKLDCSLHGVLITFSFRENPDFSKFGKVGITYPYQDNKS
jgi:hypothetical protein